MNDKVIFNYKKNNGEIREIRCYDNTVYYYNSSSDPIKNREDYHTHLILWDIDRCDWITLILDNIIETIYTGEYKDESLVDHYFDLKTQERAYWLYSFIMSGIFYYLISYIYN